MAESNKELLKSLSFDLQEAATVGLRLSDFLVSTVKGCICSFSWMWRSKQYYFKLQAWMVEIGTGLLSNHLLKGHVWEKRFFKLFSLCCSLFCLIMREKWGRFFFFKNTAACKNLNPSRFVFFLIPTKRLITLHRQIQPNVDTREDVMSGIRVARSSGKQRNRGPGQSVRLISGLMKLPLKGTVGWALALTLIIVC